MATIVLALNGLSCQHCVSNVRQLLKAIQGLESVDVTINFAKISSDLDGQIFIDAISQAGYGAALAQPNLLLQLSGLSCGHCIKKTDKVLSAVRGVEIVEVAKTEAKIYGLPEVDDVISAIVNLGYKATLADRESQSTLNSTVCSMPEQVLTSDVAVTEDKETQVTLLLEGMSCVACVMKIEKALQALPLVNNVQINLAEQTALVFGHEDPQELIRVINHEGYGAQLIDDEQTHGKKQEIQIQKEIKRYKWQAIIALLLGFTLMIWMLGGGQMEVSSSNQFSWFIVGVITLVIIVVTGGQFYQRAFKQLVKKTVTMDTLVALGTGVAWLYSMAIVLKPDFFPINSRHLYFEASAMIIGLVNLGKMLETKAKRHSSLALTRLLDLAPKTARIVDAQGEREIPLSKVQQNMILRLQTGDRVSVDGIITQGAGWIDESMLTGEPIPIYKQVGDKVSAGTLVTDGTLLFRSERVGNNTILANIIKLVRQAQSSKPQIGQLADKIASIFVPLVILIAVIAALVWYMVIGQISYSLVVLTTVLIIACPCALGLATPMSIIAGVGRAAELGILVRDADALQKAAGINTIVFDKTGTLTQGKPKVTTIYTFNGFTEQQVIQMAASLEQGANHPLAKAILSFNENVPLVEPSHFKTLKGLGVSGIIAEKQILLGNRILLEQNQIDSQLAETCFLTESKKGATVVFLAIDQQLAGLLVIRDPLRDDSQSAIQRLDKQGYRLIMLTGDEEGAAFAIAKEVGIKNVIAGILPEGKAQIIRQLQEEGHHVVMVGDGINDAPALAQANVSIAMGGGSDIAIETAELTLMRYSMHSVADALSLSKGTLYNIQQNLFFAFIYNSLGIPIAAGILYPLWGILLNPMLAGAAMALSSIMVVSNANRLLKFMPKI